VAGFTRNFAQEHAFFTKIRTALGRSEKLLHRPDHPSLKSTIPRQQEKIRTVKARVKARLPQLLSLLIANGTKAGWQIHRAMSYEEAALTIERIAMKIQARRVVRSNEEIFRRVGIDEVFRRSRVRSTVLAFGRQKSRSDLRGLAWTADLGISGVDYVIANTASCVILPRKGIARLTSLAPPVFVALVEADQIVESIDDLLAIRRWEFLRTRGRLPLSMTLISGPSRTADIEFTLTTGVHGPGEVHLIIIGNE
jgi:L-lactate dehydrogenase complex protein LldG